MFDLLAGWLLHSLEITKDFTRTILQRLQRRQEWNTFEEMIGMEFVAHDIHAHLLSVLNNCFMVHVTFSLRTIISVGN